MSTLQIWCWMFFALNISTLFGQVQNDSLRSNENSSRYQLHVRLHPHEGYGLVFGILGGITSQESNRMVYEIGIGKTTLSQDGGSFMKYLSLEINDINRNMLYEFVAGMEARSFMKIGLSLGYLSDFSSARALIIRPYIGSLFIPPVPSLYMEIGYDLSLIEPNFDLGDHWLIGIRYNIGLLEKQ